MSAPAKTPQLTDEQILDLARQWGSFEPSRWGAGFPPQFHTGQPGVIGLVRAAIDTSRAEPVTSGSV